MELNYYQTESLRTAIYPGKGEREGLYYTALGLGEAGEVQGKIKKILRDDAGVLSVEKRDAIADELGDLLWYVAACASELGYELNQIAARNMHKLASRKERGTLSGSGDNR